MADYSFNPQFANLSGLQPLPAIDVTRGANLQFRPLDKIEIQSSRPELVAEGIAGAISNIAKGALGGITARYEKKEEEEKEKRKFAHELMLYGVKQSSENENFLEKEEAKFISENSGKPNFAKKLSEFKAAQNRLKDTVPDRQQKESQESEIVEAPLPELQAEFNETPQEIPQEPALSVIPASTTGQPTKAPLAGVPIPEPAVKPEQIAEQKPLSQIGKSIDYTEYTQPQTPDSKFTSQSEAENAVSELNKTSKNPDWEFQVKEGKDEWGNREFVPVPVSVRGDRINREQKAVEISLKQKEAEQKAEEEKQKTIKIDKANVERYRNKFDDAVISIREINSAIDTINKNPNTAVGSFSNTIKSLPGFMTGMLGGNPALQVRGNFETIFAKNAFDAIQELKDASPTGSAGLGGLTEGERQALAMTQGAMNPDFMEREDIIPRLEALREARMKVLKSVSEEIKKVDPEFKIPSLQYSKPSKNKTKKDTAQETAQTGNVPVIKSQEEFDKLPSGSKFTYPGSSKIETKK
jgi:hypothetical protein